MRYNYNYTNRDKNKIFNSAGNKYDKFYLYVRIECKRIYKV